jgi:phosphatidate cytidylyltransferase
VDERDEYESEAAQPAEPVTERVRIIGAEPVGDVPPPTDVAWNTAPPAERADQTRRYLGFDADPDEPDDVTEPTVAVEVPAAEVTAAEATAVDEADNGAEPVLPDLPHWTEPATGQVPAVLDRRGDDEDALIADAGPAWREHHHEWEDAAFDPALLADDETRVGALDDAAPPEHHQWELRDLGTGEGEPVPVRDLDDTAVAPAPRSTPVSVGAEDDATEDGLATPGPAGLRPAAAAGAVAVGAEALGEADRVSDPIAPAERRAGTRRPTRRGQAPAKTRPRPATRRDGGATTPPTTGRRNVPLAIATGVGVAVVALACFAAGTVATVALATILVVLASAECFAALRRAGTRPATLLGLAATAGLMVAAYAKGVAAFPLVIALTVAATMVWYLVGAERGSPVRGISATLLGFVWVGVLGAFGGLLLAPSQYPNRHGIAFLLGAVVGVVGADVGALVVGSWVGRRPLAPNVSPNKTWEGFFGGVVVAVVLSVVITGHVHPWTPSKAAVMGLVAAVVGPVGDLCESLIKRDLGLKDMGAMLPGHGGVLDRVDALLFVLPATYYLVRVLHLG